MDFPQLNIALTNLGVVPKDVLRASLYIDYLDQAQNFFNTTMAGVGANGLGANYGFVANAVQSTELLQELADILDFYVANAVNADLQRAYAPIAGGGLGHGGAGGWTYRQYFDNVILNANNITYLNNVIAFMARYPIADYALQHLYQNFTGNIFQACQRIIADHVLLTNFYANLYNPVFAINHLKKIKSTGSDFHKGGKQVLILTFEIVHPVNNQPSVEDLKVVYKPSDLEVDCLIIGDSAAVNNVIPAFMNASLVEIYNNRLAAYKILNPGFTGEALPTYRVLPRNFISPQPPGYPLPILNAYGYIQYLDNDISGVAYQFFGYYPWGASDYLIFKSQNEQIISQKFYRQEGTLTALACTFSLLDLHIENVRVKNYEPYLIDLEICLTEAVIDVDSTQLFNNANNSGIKGFHVNNSEFDWIVNNPNVQGGASIISQYRDDYFQNRLWRWQYGRQKQLVRIVNNDLLQGFTDGMTVLRAEVSQPVSAFIAWFTRLAGVVVRFLPYATTDFRDIRNAIFINVFNSPNRNAAYLVQRDFVLLTQLTQTYQQYAVPDLPNFLAWQDIESGVDYNNLDIPVYYHRIGTQDIFNSRGAMVAIPANVNITNPAAPPPTIPAAVNLGGRLTFFPNLPTDINIDVGQVQILGGAIGPFNARVLVLQPTILAGLGAVAPPNPAEIIPVDRNN